MSSPIGAYGPTAGASRPTAIRRPFGSARPGGSGIVVQPVTAPVTPAAASPPRSRSTSRRSTVDTVASPPEPGPTPVPRGFYPALPRGVNVGGEELPTAEKAA